MKHLYTCVAIGIASVTNAQLINGSFESNSGFSLEGWEWSCADPAGWLEAPVGGGDWSAFKEPGHAKGCFPSYLYQRISDVPFGQELQFSGWVRCPVGDVVFCIGATIGFGVINNGVITPFGSVTSVDPEWSFVSVNHVFEPSLEDTAIVLLSAGFIGGPISPAPAGFDQLELALAQGIEDVPAARVSHYPDPVSDVLHVGIAQGRILTIDVLDEGGRIVLTSAGGTGTRQVPVAALPQGTYISRVFTDVGEQRFPFVKR